MKAKDLAKALMQYPDHEVEFRILEFAPEELPTLRTFEITGIADIGHASKITILDGKED